MVLSAQGCQLTGIGVIRLSMRQATYCVNGAETAECILCPNRCVIGEGQRGRCLARGMVGGRLVSFSYGVVVAAGHDPIEKKPLYHFCPGRSIFSVGSFGCNLFCRFCQNSEISQKEVPGRSVSPDELAILALSRADNIGVAFTYNEPGISFEYIVDSAPKLKESGLKTVLVTNGYFEPDPWKELCGVTDAMNIDLKGFTEEFYHDSCGGQLSTVLDNINTAYEAGVHLELTNLVIPGLNDDAGTFERMIQWISVISPAVPLHISRYFPRHLETRPSTSSETLMRLYEVARKRLDFVYLGNIDTEAGSDTVCPGCGKVLVRRRGYEAELVVSGSACDCGRETQLRM